MEVQQKIIKSLKSKCPGKIFFPTEFRSIGNEYAVNMALSRLAKEGVIDRVAKGIYVIPKEDPMLGKIPPSMETIAEAIAKRDFIKIRPAGDFALHKLGISTQMPLKLIYVTDGAPRTIRIGKRSIVFKSTTPKKLATIGKISSLVIQGLEALSKKNITPEIKYKIAKLLEREHQDMIQKDALLAPTWISRILLENINENKK